MRPDPYEQIASMMRQARTELRAVPRRFHAMCIESAGVHLLWTGEASERLTRDVRLLRPDLRTFPLGRPLDLTWRTRPCIIERPQYFIGLPAFLQASGELAVLLCESGVTHPEMDLTRLLSYSADLIQAE